VDNDFAEAKPAALSGHVYHDANNNGVMDPGESGIGGVTLDVQRVVSNAGTLGLIVPRQTVTDASGAWSVGNLMPGDYLVTETQPDPQIYIDGLDAAGNAGGAAHNPGDLIDGIHLLSGQSGEDYDFGEIMYASIQGRVIADVDGDCVYTLGDYPIEDVTVELLDADGQVLRVTETDANGEYAFMQLVPGVYGVREQQPDGYYDGGDHVGSEDGTLLDPDSIIDITLASAAVGVGYDFCEILPSSISGRVYVDNNGNGQRDAKELLLSGVTIHLLNAAGKSIKTTETNAAGEYSFDDLPPGVYGVMEEQPDGYFDGPDQVGSADGSLLLPDSIIDVELISGTHGVNYDFRETPPVSLSGHVYADDNDNGLFDKNEAGISNAILSLLDATGTPTGETTVTDADGFYHFDDLGPGTYGVAETQPDGFFDGKDRAGSAGGMAENPGDRITRATLKGGVDAVDYNFGELRPASISGRVHADLIINCMVDPDEPLLSGVTVYLLDASGSRIDVTTTNDKGIYLFENLKPGVYGVEEIQPEEYLDGRDHVGDAGGYAAQDDRITGAQLGPGVDGQGYNFCEIVPARISGYVFRDGPVIRVLPGEEMPEPADVSDGQLTADDTRIAGVVLTLADASGVSLLDENGQPMQTTTDARGYYEFTMLEPGAYSILQEHPKGFIDGIDSPGIILNTLGIVVSLPEVEVSAEQRPSSETSLFGAPDVTASSRNGTAVNAHESVDPSILQQFAVDPKNDAIIQIWLNAGEQGTLYNFSEVQMVRIPIPIPDPEPDPFPEPIPAVPFDPAAIPYLAPPPVYVAPRGFDLFGHSGGYTWHLSVLNGGQPRRDGLGNFPQVSDLDDPRFGALGWSTVDLDQSQWIVANDQGVPVERIVFGAPGSIGVVGDFNGDGVDEVGVFAGGYWMLDLNG
ncbi:MAG TPA: SdrD B-like domain-containing protein, partial [Thermoguttaceae bacterium]|nr:SdrD B-like domain-containing protein [Thermoguttaceae bacterium]